MNLHSNQVYTGINWAKKYKAPTDWCIAIKLTQLQMKRSQYIKYICADDEQTFRRWLVGLRIAKSIRMKLSSAVLKLQLTENGVNLMSNYARACERRREALSQQPVCVPPPRVATIVSHRLPRSSQLVRHDLGSNYSDHSGKVGHVYLISTLLNFFVLAINLCFFVASSMQSPSQASRLSAVSTERCISVANSTAIHFQEYDEQPTGTIKRAST
ncbi:hypothetical protein OSTOST_13524 [Ostertagia ostertagi]